MFRISVLRGTKLKPELVKVAEVMADRFEVAGSPGVFDNAGGISFFIDEERFWSSTKSTLVAFLPGTDWTVERI